LEGSSKSGADAPIAMTAMGEPFLETAEVCPIEARALGRLGGRVLLFEPSGALVDLVEVGGDVEEDARVRAPPDVVAAHDAATLPVRGKLIGEVVVADAHAELVEELVVEAGQK